MAENMARFFYKMWYEKDVAPNLSYDEKVKLAKRISNLTLVNPIWLDRKKNWINEFPELKPYSHSGKISGLQLCTVMASIVNEMQAIDGLKNGEA